jgi:hypothetical protein
MVEHTDYKLRCREQCPFVDKNGETACGLNYFLKQTVCTDTIDEVLMIVGEDGKFDVITKQSMHAVYILRHEARKHVRRWADWQQIGVIGQGVFKTDKLAENSK